MKKQITLILLSVLTLSAVAETKQVAILPVVEQASAFTGGQKLMVSGILTDVITDLNGYEGYDRVNLSSIVDEQKFQRSGYVDDDQVKQIGKMTGCQYVLIVVMEMFDAQNVIFSGRILNAETAKIEQSGTSDGINNIDGYKKACSALVRRLLKVDLGKITSSSSSSSSSNNSTNQNGQNYNPDGIELVWVEGTGSGIMATQGFYIGKYEVTQAQWKAVMGSNPSIFKGDNLPVENVSWEDCQDFIRKLNQMTGRKYALPTEAQWEYAARGGKASESYEYAGSNSIGQVAWYCGNSGNRTNSVGNLSPNSLGIYDMSGNVWEWCKDCYDSSCSSRVNRGGSWFNDATGCRVAYRNNGKPSCHSRDLGFRVVLLP